MTTTAPAPGYEVLAHLARTRRYDTFEVWSAERACSCVIKTLRPDRADDAAARAALLAEGRLLLSLSHPHVVRAYELVERPVPALVLETLDGETVAHLAERRGGLDAGEVAWLGLHVASALRYLHGRRRLHLDLKGANVIADSGRAKVIDLSLARPPGRYAAGLGTWCNLAPEQARGEAVGPPADVWGLGTILHEAATGTPAFGDPEGSWTATGSGDPGTGTGTGPTWDTAAHAEAGYPQLEGPAPSAASSGLPGGLVAAIDACLAADPAARPTLAELAERIRSFAP